MKKLLVFIMALMTVLALTVGTSAEYTYQSMFDDETKQMVIDMFVGMARELVPTLLPVILAGLGLYALKFVFEHGKISFKKAVAVDEASTGDIVLEEFWSRTLEDSEPSEYYSDDEKERFGWYFEQTEINDALDDEKERFGWYFEKTDEEIEEPTSYTGYTWEDINSDGFLNRVESNYRSKYGDEYVDDEINEMLSERQAIEGPAEWF